MSRRVPQWVDTDFGFVDVSAWDEDVDDGPEFSLDPETVVRGERDLANGDLTKDAFIAASLRLRDAAKAQFRV